MADSARKAAVEALMRLHCGQAFSNKVVDSFLKKYDFSVEDKSLFSRLVYGVEERKMTLDYIIQQHCKMPLKRIHPCVLESLRIGVYQILFMEKIPVSASVNESVKIVRSMKQEKATGLTNAVLRAIDRKFTSFGEEKSFRDFIQTDDELQQWEVEFSCPKNLINLWIQSYGKEMTKQLLSCLNNEAPIYIRLNSLKFSKEKFEEFCDKQNLFYKECSYLPMAYEIDSYTEKKLRQCFTTNEWYHQDYASQLCLKALDAQPGETIADVCAAPGGKSLGIAQAMNNQGTLYSMDFYPNKCDEMQERAKTMGIDCIETMPRDASKPCPSSWIEKFDRVLCDVPCSGFGVIRRRPEIRYHDFNKAMELPKLQYAILEESSKMVKPGGVLEYSTCTLNAMENEEVVELFLKNHPEYRKRELPLNEFFTQNCIQPSWKLTLFPHVYGTDGFFMASFEKESETK